MLWSYKKVTRTRGKRIAIQITPRRRKNSSRYNSGLAEEKKGPWVKPKTRKHKNKNKSALVNGLRKTKKTKATNCTCKQNKRKEYGKEIVTSIKQAYEQA